MTLIIAWLVLFNMGVKNVWAYVALVFIWLARTLCIYSVEVNRHKIYMGEYIGSRPVLDLMKLARDEKESDEKKI